jgi:undecaprenyl-diphosphatase
MDFFTAIIAGLLQGIFEWLPISSQGNIIGALFLFFNTNPEEALQIAVMLHIGTLLAAIIYFKKEIKEMLFTKRKEKETQQMLKFIIIATIATAITAVPSYLLLEKILGTSIALVLLLLAVLLIITGLIQLFRKKIGNGEVNWKNAILTGLGQGFSVLPGVSRSGTTTSVLLFRGFEPEKAFRVSFLMSIPAVLLAELGYGIIKGFIINEMALLAMIIAFIIGLASMDLLIKMAKKINFAYFCFLLAGIYIVAFIMLLH